jgi:hypothetical protein
MRMTKKSSSSNQKSSSAKKTHLAAGKTGAASSSGKAIASKAGKPSQASVNKGKAPGATSTPKAPPALTHKPKSKTSAATGHLKKSTSTGSSKSSMELGDTVCREVACEGLSTSGGYCRLHYIKNWKKIKRKELILREKKLNQYIEELVAKYPDKYIEAIRQDLANDKDFAKVIYDLDLDEGVDDFDSEGGDSVDSLIDTIKRDFDDDSEGF